MAKKQQDLTNIFAKTAAPGAAQPASAASVENWGFDLDSGLIRSMGIGLKDGEVRALEQVAARYGITRNAVGRIAVRYFLREVEAGHVHMSDYVETTTTKTAKMP